MKVSNLEGPLLDAAVAKAEGLEVDRISSTLGCELAVPHLKTGRFAFAPSQTWAHGGPIIERERIAVWADDDAGSWHAMHPTDDGGYYKRGMLDVGSFDGHSGETPLIAAMRAYVASKFADEVPAITPGKDVR